MKGLESLSVVAILCWLAVVGTLFAASVHGIVLAFSAHLILGLVYLFIHPVPLITGIAYWFSGYDIAAEIVNFASTLM